MAEESDAFVLIADCTGGAVGYAVVHMRSGEETWGTGGRVAKLETLTVLPGFRARGIGSALIERVFEELRGIGVANLGVSVIAANRRAVRFYERLGLLPFTVSYLGSVPPAPK